MLTIVFACYTAIPFLRGFVGAIIKDKKKQRNGNQ
jgi:hypothetical protein